MSRIWTFSAKCMPYRHCLNNNIRDFFCSSSHFCTQIRGQDTPQQQNNASLIITAATYLRVCVGIVRYNHVDLCGKRHEKILKKTTSCQRYRLFCRIKIYTPLLSDFFFVHSNSGTYTVRLCRKVCGSTCKGSN